MATLLRSLGAVLAGLVAAGVLIVGNEYLGSILHPFPPGVDPSDYEACKAHVARYPAAALLLGAVGWGLSAFVGAWLATLLGTGRHAAHGIVVGVILLAAAVTNMAMLPYPIWFWAVNLVFFPLGTYLGVRLGGAGAVNKSVTA